MLAAEPHPEHEALIVRHGERSGAQIVIAVHSTALGPALGGCRMWTYRTLDDAVSDALRLSHAMTLKAAAADLPLGGGKGVICIKQPELRELALRDFADAVNTLGGRYITAEDVGTSSADMASIGRSCDHVAGLPHRSGDPSPFTAAGVVAAMRACCRHAFGSGRLDGLSVAVVGLGNVGGRLARMLADAGAELVLSDIDPAKRRLALELPRTRWMDPASAIRADVDVLSPCALGGVIDNAAALGCRIVCGAANNQLASDDLADALARRGILYAPDFIVNAGGLINIACELGGYDAELAASRVAEIEPRIARLLADRSTTPLAAATRLAHDRLRAGRRPWRSASAGDRDRARRCC
jgi:leucine dehydrogenase